ncbi:hypothetical protein BLA60_14395 [Actinophytocola xinjiangensis]|uniref:YDG domain-containing protein n=1 Tax=Actinophytocola xinjiangensis TaxID=485602 RepID=A0A7Z0WRF9_9PSEU|nr:hypothetical protein BLA60_14395 [Actinophytocola xinjiangensis]
MAGYPEGSTFANRAALHRSGVHRPTQAGICGTGAFGAESIVVSGGYIDDQDLGNLIIYTGHGGQDKNKRQVADQTFEDSGNAGLLTSSISGALVRVIRGAHKGSSYAPESGLRYDGLYRVVDAWREAGQHGFQVCRYKLTKADSGPGARKRSDLAVPDGEVTPGRRDETVQRIVRSTKVSRFIKSLYDDTCQACRTRLVVAGDRSYSEGAHIRPLGRGHDGPDIPSNVLCLCPNCHVLFDNGAMIIDAERQVWVNGTLLGPLTVDDQHYVDEAHLAYHRDHYGAAGSGA